MVKKRTNEKIAKDYNRIRLFVNRHIDEIKSLSYIAKSLNLTNNQVKKSLEGHSQFLQKIEEAIARNKKGNLSKETKIVPKSNLDIEQASNIEVKCMEDESLKDETTNYYVLDASVCGSDDIFGFFKSENIKIIISDLTIHELDLLQGTNDHNGRNARQILAMAVNDEVKFICKRITPLDNVDDSIINYCYNNYQRVTLITSDKVMCLKARSYGVNVVFFQHNKESDEKKSTFYKAEFISGKLYLNKFKTDSSFIRLISDGIEYDEGNHELKIGDYILIATKKDGYSTFIHFSVVAIAPYNNCQVIKSKRFYTEDEINSLDNALYKAFMKDFAQYFS